MAINFGNKLRTPTPTYERQTSAEADPFSHDNLRSSGNRTMHSIYGGTTYSQCEQLRAQLAKLNEANSRFDSALDRANASAFGALNSINHLK